MSRSKSARVSSENERARPQERAPCSPARGFPACSATGTFWPPLTSVPLERAFLPQVGEPEEEDGDEDEHFDEDRPSALPEHDGPGVEERRFDVEQDEDHRDDEELDADALVAVVEQRHAALVRRELPFRADFPAEEGVQAQEQDADAEGAHEHEQNRQEGEGRTHAAL